jgi:hypothetical protein
MKRSEVVGEAVASRSESYKSSADTLLLLCNDLLLCPLQPAIAAAQGKDGTLQAAYAALARRRGQAPTDSMRADDQ